MGSKGLTTTLSLPNERSDMYTESDGKPMAEADVHRDLMADFIEMLKNHFKDRLDAYVSGNLLLYYEKGDPKKSVVPDVFVAFGIEKKLRRTYLLWEEDKGHDFVLETTSKSTVQSDAADKKALYAQVLGVKEYYIYDPNHRYLHPFF